MAMSHVILSCGCDIAKMAMSHVILACGCDIALRQCPNGIVACHNRSQTPAFCPKGLFLVFSVLVVTFSSELRFRFRKNRWTHNWIPHTFKPINIELLPKIIFPYFYTRFEIHKNAGVTHTNLMRLACSRSSVISIHYQTEGFFWR